MTLRNGAIFAWVLVGCSAFAQMPDRFTNLQVFPKDIPKKELTNIMRRFSFSLGVRCEFCHVQTADKKMNFPADDKKEKQTARLMLKMVSEINQNYINKIGKPAPVEVRCVTCHRGLSQPRQINDVLAETIEKKGIDAAVAQYKELKAQYYGGAQYSFGETPLNVLTESLLDKDKGKEAAAIMELNVETNSSPSGWTMNLLAMAHQAAGETDKAIADFQKIVQTNPQNEWAKQQLETLTKKKQ